VDSLNPPASGVPDPFDDAELQEGLVINEELWEAMHQDVRQRTPQEACGLVAGKQGRARMVIPITNSLQSPVRYHMDPQEQLAAFNLLDEKELDVLAIYHSHPSGPAGPSATDIAEAYYPQAIYLIWWRQGEAWRCCGYLIRQGQVREVPLRRVIE
jgi:proteasome lid subunit RPN8/RPN11